MRRENRTSSRYAIFDITITQMPSIHTQHRDTVFLNCFHIVYFIDLSIQNAIKFDWPIGCVFTVKIRRPRKIRIIFDFLFGVIIYYWLDALLDRLSTCALCANNHWNYRNTVPPLSTDVFGIPFDLFSVLPCQLNNRLIGANFVANKQFISNWILLLINFVSLPLCVCRQ